MNKPNFIDLTGKRFSRWFVVERAINKNGGSNWLCRCDCGNEKEVRSASLVRSLSTSCGCFRNEQTRKSNTKHGGSKRSGRLDEYNIWKNMRQRCNNPKQPAFKWYGGRGIKICKRWDDFSLFLSDMGLRPSKKHSIDRIDNDGNYSPNNCRWTTAGVQRINSRPKGTC